MARVWRMLRRRSVVVAVCLVAAWAGLMGSPGDDGVVYAIGNDLWDDGFACFVSGPTRDLGYVDGKSQQDAQGFGEDGGYVLERQDLFALLGESYGKTRQTADNWSYFNRGFAQAVDWLFAMYPEDVMFDGHGDSLPTLDDQMYDFFLWSGAGSVWPAVCGSECHIGKDDDLEIKIGGDRVYDKMGHYLDQRAVARYYQEPVRSFVAAWYDPRAPEGGLRINEAAVQADAQELNERFVEATSGSAVRGNRIISGTNEVPYVLVNGSFGSTCTGGGSTTCTVDSSFDSTQEMATVQQVSVDQTNDEQFQQEVDDDLQTGNVEAREGNPSGYATLGQEDTGEDTIFVSLVLDSTYRRDFAFEVSGEDGGKKRLWAFGREPWDLRQCGWDEGRA